MVDGNREEMSSSFLFCRMKIPWAGMEAVVSEFIGRHSLIKQFLPPVSPWSGSSPVHTYHPGWAQAGHDTAQVWDCTPIPW